MQERATDGGWSLAIADQGPGIAPEHRERIFDAFTRGDTFGKSGVGLGLAIAFESAKRLGGQLTVDSHLGSVFRLTMPQLVG